MKLNVCIGLLAYMSVAPGLHAEVVKCTDAEGNITFSDQPCALHEQSSVVPAEIFQKGTVVQTKLPDQAVEADIIQKRLDSGIGGDIGKFYRDELQRIEQGQFGQLDADDYLKRNEALDILADKNASAKDVAEAIQSVEDMYRKIQVVPVAAPIKPGPATTATPQETPPGSAPEKP